jgi:hypothetical protein
MPAELVNAMPSDLKNLCNQQAEFAVPKNGNVSASRKRCLIQDLAGGGDRFDKDGDLGRNRHWDYMKIRLRESEKFTESAGVPDNAQHLPSGTMSAKSPSAPIAAPACQVDLPHNSAADETRVICHDNLTDEFVSRSA